jgi:hypothetical protein
VAVCTPSDETEDPITDLGFQDSITEDGGGEPKLLVELVEVAVDAGRELIWGVGQGGLIAYSIQDPLAPTRLSHSPSHGFGRFHHVFPFPSTDEGAGVVYVSHRSQGLVVFDATDPAAPVEGPHINTGGLEGMTQVGEHFYVVSRTGEVLSLDISDRMAPFVVARSSGLGLPWAIVGDEQALYVADQSLGVVVLERSNPHQPSVKESHDVGGGVQAVAINDSLLVAAAGSAGIHVFSRENPLQLEWLASYSVGTSVQDILLDGELIWAVTQESVLVVDASDPRQLMPLASRKTPYWAMTLDSHKGNAWVGDWGALRGYALDPEISAADIDAQSSEILLHPDGQTLDFSLSNRGSDTLCIEEITPLHSDLEVSVLGALEVAPGGVLELEITWPGGDLDTLLRIRSNDPDAALLDIKVHTGGVGDNSLGTLAPDFTLEDLDGEPHTLSSYLGHPVVIAYFATW